MAANIHDVAALAGVSPRTVSNVVNDFVHVRPETRVRVQAAIEKLGYRPNISARRLRQGKTRILAFAVPELSQPYFSELSELIERAAQRRGYTVMAAQTGGLRERELGILREFGSHVVDGLILSPMVLQADDLMANRPSVPVVLIGEQISSEAFVDIAIDNVRAVHDLTGHLIDTGRTRIAALGAYSSPGYRSADLRLEGYRSALAAAGIPFDASRILYTDQYSRQAGHRAVHEAVERGLDFDALVCFNDVLALGALRALADRGISVPEQVAVTGMDDIDDSAYCVPSLTTISPDKEAIAESAVARLLELIDDPEADASDIEPSFRLITRESSASLR
ncbi:LacI family DNA-binding transcriptional regulator [Glaciibacter psychrotolerans]|uniref:DNA-binding LacI/PurR family transcriptional regulator n=1 Tax=Glaciibacter psychrotolerans TaxID=670054 RepID=A0A7Z0EF48_9MICO|nr:LacI family DNA-binding transcriptional regulator [Leifsonia psychrotolerans]NYJ20371.1 DNA-binding LacI/PurR family transcriptional regulator [Leifsonia psychrotolerans]